jgi:hypothetical protein
MTLSLSIEQEIVRLLRPLLPAKIILFGSYAKGIAKLEALRDLYLEHVYLPGLCFLKHEGDTLPLQYLQPYIDFAKMVSQTIGPELATQKNAEAL